MQYTELTEFEEWNTKNNRAHIDVSVFCITYNHVKFIEETLSGFVNQKGTISYEVIIFDDASTDGTSDIIREYARRYPNIIKAYISRENTYRCGIRRRKLVKSMQAETLRGKYIAFCEGDDYWIDPYKLQIQFEYMEKHNNCSLFIHNAIWVNYKNYEIFAGSPFQCKKGIKVSAENLIMLYNRHPSTASFFFNRELLDMPPIFDIGPVGDYTRMLYLQTKGYVYYSSRIMSVYRWKSEGSATSRIMQDKWARSRFNVGMIIFLLRYNEYTCRKYSMWINNRIQSYLNSVVYSGEEIEKLQTYVNDFELEEPLIENECGVYYDILRTMVQQVNDTSYVSQKTRRFCHRKKHIVIMGAGNYAKRCSEQLDRNKISYEGFAVSDLENAPDYLKEKQVWSLTEIPFKKTDFGLLIAIDPLHWDDILKSIKKAGIKSYFCPYLLTDNYREMK